MKFKKINLPLKTLKNLKKKLKKVLKNIMKMRNLILNNTLEHSVQFMGGVKVAEQITSLNFCIN
jgi:hypothetical protein